MIRVCLGLETIVEQCIKILSGTHLEILKKHVAIRKIFNFNGLILWQSLRTFQQR